MNINGKLLSLNSINIITLNCCILFLWTPGRKAVALVTANRDPKYITVGWMVRGKDDRHIQQHTYLTYNLIPVVHFMMCG